MFLDLFDSLILGLGLGYILIKFLLGSFLISLKFKRLELYKLLLFSDE